MNANSKLIRNAKSLSYALFATKTNERRRWWIDNDGDPRIAHRAKKHREYESWVSPEAEVDVSLLYGEAPYLKLLSTVTIPVTYIIVNGKTRECVDIYVKYRFGNSTRLRTSALNCVWYPRGGDGHGVLVIRSVTHYPQG